MERQRVLKRTNRRKHGLGDWLAGLDEIVTLISQPLGLNALLRAIHGEMARLLDATVFIVGLYHEASRTVDVIQQIISGAEVSGGSFPLGEGFTSQVIRTRQPRLIRNWSTEGPRVRVQYATDRSGLPESGIIVPIIVHDRVLGVLMLQSYSPEAYDENDQRFLSSVAGLVGVAITGLRVSESLDAQLRQRVLELETILSSMADALLIVDSAGCVTRLNHAARKLMCTDTIVLGQPLNRQRWGLWSVGNRELAEALGPMIEALQRGEALHDVEVQVVGEGRRVLSGSGAPILDADRAPCGGVIVFRDVTDRHDMERVKDEVLSIASHDLKTPIAAIKLHAQVLHRMIARGTGDLERLDHGLARIMHQSDYLTELLNLLLDLSRIEAGRLEIHPTCIDLVQVAQLALELIETMTTDHVLSLEAPERLEGEWDAPRLKQVIQNLLTNALKYSPGGGPVTVKIEADEHIVTVRVCDRGIGLAEEERPQVFERFFRAGSSRRLEGSGLGLYICRTIVVAHGGHIWAESDGPGRGSTFAFTLPRRATPAGSLTK